MGGVLLGDITFPREVGSMDDVFATVLIAEVLGGMLLVAGATLDGGGRTVWIYTMCVSCHATNGPPRKWSPRTICIAMGCPPRHPVSS